MARSSRVRNLVVIAVGAAVAVAAAYYWRGEKAAEAPHYRLAGVERGAILMAVTATGKVNPVVTVQVGSQVSGQISELAADFNTVVKSGQVIARIDPAQFEARLTAARADLAVTQANVSMQEAGVAELVAEISVVETALKDAEQDLRRKQALMATNATSASALDKAMNLRDQARARLDSARAQVKKQRAQVETAQAQVQSKIATLHDRELDLERTFIRSPVDGVVIGRNVDLGQTVAASLQAPVLFSIAQDLGRMQVEISVDEADIGRIREGQGVKFTVDAYPKREFAGRVTQIRKAPTEVSNVITYTVVAGADNSDLALLPGMTANVDVVIGERLDALKVADAALRFNPPGAAPPAASQAGGGDGGGPGAGGPEAARARLQALVERLTERLKLTPAQQEQVRGFFMETGMAIRGLREGGMPPEQLREAIQKLRAQTGKRVESILDDTQKTAYRLLQAEQEAGSGQRGRVWIVGPDGKPKAVDVVTGISDGTATEIVRGELAADAQVIVGIASAAAPR